MAFFPLLALVFFACQKDVSQMPSLSSNASGGPKAQYDVPTVTATSTQTTITLTLTAGATGAMDGFSVQWLEQSYFDANGWDGTQCGASFSGNASGSIYNLAANASVPVVIGNIDLTKAGASVDDGCNAPLQCGKTYVFRVFAHGSNLLGRSEFSTDYTFSTLSCGCTYKSVEDLKSDCSLLPSVMTIGSNSYSGSDLCTILRMNPGQGGALVRLAQAVIAAKYNGVNTSVADALIGTKNPLVAADRASVPNNFGAQVKDALLQAITCP
jgi:hypothetical protein